MGDIINKIVGTYTYVFEDLSDPRTKESWLLSGPGPLVTILATYLYFCIKAGPAYMETRKPYNLKTILMLYNIFMIIVNFTGIICGLCFVFIEKYEDGCYSIDTSNSSIASVWVLAVCTFYYTKLIELLDTVFFILRKKDKQVTFLHLYHHTIMPIVAFLGCKYAPGGQSVPEGSINFVIHVVMYTYYLISGLGPQYQKYLWWKKHVTTLQLIQFCLISYLNVNSLLSKSCNYPKFQSLLVLVNCVAFFYMFGKFYYKSYVTSYSKKENVPEKDL